MSSDVQSLLASLQLNNYTSVAIITAVAYDYILTFPSEIDYIWNRSWTWISVMFVVVRYIGIFCSMTDALFGSTFMPGPAKICTVIFSIGNSVFTVFLSAADLVMLLRVYAMYNRSRIVLGILLAVYIPAVVLLVIATAMYTDPKYLSVTTLQILDSISFCVLTSTAAPNVGRFAFIPRFILGGLMCIFAVVQFVRQSLEMYRVTKHWQPNRYLNLLVREGVLYFIVNMLYNIVSLLSNSASAEGAYIAMETFCYVVLYIIMPRFIINVRELSMSTVRGDGWGIDTGFGLSQSGMGVGAVGGNMVFAVQEGAVGDSEGSGGDEEMRMVDGGEHEGR